MRSNRAGAERLDSQAKNDLEASHGIVVQTRAVALPQVQATANTRSPTNAIEAMGGLTQPQQNWNAGVQIVQSIYMGGKMIAAIRAADATKQRPCHLPDRRATRC